MKNYNNELQELYKKQKELIKEAQNNGWILKKDKLYKEEKIPCLEVYFRFELDYESYGHFAFFKKTVPITEEEYDKCMGLVDEKENLFEYIDELCNKYTELNIFNSYEYDCSSEPMINTYEIDEVEEEVLEIFFNNKPGYNYIDGYLNVYKIDSNRLKEQDDVNVELNKYMRYN